MTTLLGRGIYTYLEAARLTGLKPSRVREWFRGRSKERDARKPVFTGDYEPIEGDFAVSFYDLVDVYVAGQLRDHGVALQTLRKVYAKMREDLQTKHPFCRRELLSNGKIVFMRAVDAAGEDQLTEVLTRQKVFPDIILPFLKKIDYDNVRLLAQRWRIADLIVIDPAICFGTPVVEAVGIPTHILAASYKANGERADAVARWYNIAPKDVLAAVKFEGSLAA